jgi:hypothetical protein
MCVLRVSRFVYMCYGRIVFVSPTGKHVHVVCLGCGCHESVDRCACMFCTICCVLSSGLHVSVHSLWLVF